MKLKINEIEKELKELREENELVHKTIVEISQKQVEDYKSKLNKTQGLDATNKSMLISKLKTGMAKLVVKDYNLNQILEIVHDVMKQKQAYDEKSFKQQNPSETLENFLYIYFSQKYGLKEMIKVEVSSVIEKISSFSKENTEVEAFRRILKNEIDEKFYWYM